MAEPLLALRGVRAGYGDAVVLDDVSFDVPDRGSLAVLGRNGVGKSTLLLTIMGHTAIGRGTITWRGADITALASHRRARAGLGWVAQEREIFPSLTVEENLTVAARRGRKVIPDSEPDKGLFYRSDHLSFAKIGVPSAYFKAGIDFVENPETKRRVQLAYTQLYYHQPNDQFDARWDLGGAVEDARLLLECLVLAADAAEAPRWTPGDEFEKLR